MGVLEQVIQQLINGISLGSVYALIALGYTMVYGIIKLINFAHGEIFMIGSFVGYFFNTSFDLSSKITARWPAMEGTFSVYFIDIIATIGVAMIVCATLGMVVERLAYKPLRGAHRVAALMTAVGVSLFFQNLAIYWIGAEPKGYPRLLPSQNYNFLGATISNRQIMIVGSTILLMVLLQYIVHKTKMGKAMRAVSLDKDAARLMGINVDATISFTFAIGSALAAAGGILYSSTYGRVEPLLGLLPGLKAFVSAVLGGIGIIPGAALGGLILGISEAGVSALGYSTIRDAVAFAILIVILLIKPTGILGKNVREKV
ncbi:MAG: branched-chain amino acid ABC transporter permease [Firmicutes bacterium]|nr:branched-chain amino acid ABC transporter permease [Bacillota bacterium]